MGQKMTFFENPKFLRFEPELGTVMYLSKSEPQYRFKAIKNGGPPPTLSDYKANLQVGQGPNVFEFSQKRGQKSIFWPMLENYGR